MWGKDPDNPFKEWVGPGARVIIKPNWVRHNSPNEAGLDALVTHAALIKHLIDLVAVALRPILAPLLLATHHSKVATSTRL